MNLSKRNLFIIGAILALPLIYFLLWILPQQQSAAYRAKFTDEEVQKFQAEQKIQYERNVADIEDKTRLTLAQIIGGLALLSGLYFTYQNIRVNEEGKLTDRFSNAVELLGSEKLDIRIGGIYALERIARDSQKDHWTVMEVLTAFVRENSNKRIKKEGSIKKNLSKQRKLSKGADQKPAQVDEKETKDRPEDILAVMTIISRRKWRKIESQAINLGGANLSNITFENLKLEKLDLLGTNFNNAAFVRIDLSETNMFAVDLSDATILWMDLSNARLERANLSKASLFQVNLNDANLYEANLDGTDLEFAENLTLSQILSAENVEKAILPIKLRLELKEWKAKQEDLRPRRPFLQPEDQS